MTAKLEARFRRQPPSLTNDMLRTLQADATARAELLRQIIGHFEGKYQCSLEAFERKLENLEVPEHPGWEESIEWRNAVEQLERIEMNAFLGDPAK